MQSTTCTTVLFPGNLAPNLQNSLGRGASRKGGQAKGARPTSLAPPHCSHTIPRMPWAHMACGSWHRFDHWFQTTGQVATPHRVPNQ